MKKLVSLISAVVLACGAVPMAVSAASQSNVFDNIAPYGIGDVNQDGVVDATDACKVILRYALIQTDAAGNPDSDFHLRMLNDENLSAKVSDILNDENILTYGDVDGDGKADASDATLILSYYGQFMSTED